MATAGAYAVPGVARLFRIEAEIRVRSLLCKAPGGPLRQKRSDTYLCTTPYRDAVVG